MKFSSRVTLVSLFAVAVFDATALKAGQIVLDAYNGIYPGQGGGEFTAYTSQNFLGNYSPLATLSAGGGPYLSGASTTGFETFCLETGVDYTPGNWGGQTYYYTLGNTTQPLPANASSGNGLPLSAGAAYLYYLFGTGHLAGFDYTYGPGRQADDNLLQAAIWAFQGQQTYGSYAVPSADPSSPNYDPYYAGAITALGGLAGADSAYTGSEVEVLQLWSNSNDTGAAQNQLVLVPDGGSTAALLGIALSSFAIYRRRS
jgi:hypothetical protein